MAKTQQVGARELKTRLGRYLRAVRSGTTLVVTERGQPVAELRPIERAGSDLDAHLFELERKGIVTRGSGAPPRAHRLIRLKGKPITDTLLDGREDRF